MKTKKLQMLTYDNFMVKNDMKNKFRHLDLFTGIGGFRYAAETVWGDEYENVACCEIEKFCQQIILKHWPDTRIINDVRDEAIKQFKDIDILTAGVPCQPASVAGKKRGVNDARWLWPETISIIGSVRPRYALLENVAGLFSVDTETPSTEFYQDWPKSGMTVGGKLYRLVPLVRYTNETGSGLLLTPSTVAIEGGEDRIEKRTAYRKSIGRQYVPGCLVEQIVMLPTPTTGDRRSAKSNQQGINNVIALLPMPTVNGNYNRKGTSKTSGNGLATMLATPSAADCTGSHGGGQGKSLRTDIFNLNQTLLPTPKNRDWKGKSQRGNYGNTTDCLPNAINGKKTGLKLQPAFVMWMMGFPEDWLDLKDGELTHLKRVATQ